MKIVFALVVLTIIIWAIVMSLGVKDAPDS